MHDPTDTAPSWYLSPCTDWKGASATCLYGFGSLTGANFVSPTLQSSYSGTDYILDAQVYAIEVYDAQIGTRMSTTPGHYYSNELYVNSNGGDNFYIAYKHPDWVQVATGVAGDLYLDTWYQLEANPQGTTQEASTQYGTYSVSGTDSNYTSGAAGPSLDKMLQPSSVICSSASMLPWFLLTRWDQKRRGISRETLILIRDSLRAFCPLWSENRGRRPASGQPFLCPNSSSMSKANPATGSAD